MKDTQNKTEEQKVDSDGEQQNAEQETKTVCGCCGARNRKQ